jgi:hypothetical protein
MICQYNASGGHVVVFPLLMFSTQFLGNTNFDVNQIIQIFITILETTLREDTVNGVVEEKMKDGYNVKVVQY